MKNIQTAFRTWPAGLRILSYVVAGVVAIALVGGSAALSYATFLAPPLHRATVARCHHDFAAKNARETCVGGDVAKAKSLEHTYLAEQRKQEKIERCQDDYSDASAAILCEVDKTAQADAAQKKADAAAAAAEKKATEGQSYDNPYPAGTKASMQSTNRLDGSVVTYTEWITGYDANWTGYDSYEAPDTGMKYIAFIVNVQATDAGVDAGTLAYDASFTDPNGTVYSHAGAQYGASNQMPQVTLGAGQQASGIVVFEVPISVTGGVATFGDGSVFEALQ